MNESRGIRFYIPTVPLTTSVPFSRVTVLIPGATKGATLKSIGLVELLAHQLLGSEALVPAKGYRKRTLVLEK